MNPLRLFSKVAASSPKKLSFDTVCDVPFTLPVSPKVSQEEFPPFVVTTRGDPKLDPLVPCEELLIPGALASSTLEVSDVSPPAMTTPSRSTRKRGQSPVASESGSPVGASKLPTPGRGKKTPSSGQRGYQPSSAGKTGHHHRRSLSNLPRFENGATATDFPSVPQARALRQSASFSGISVPRGGRPPTSGEISLPLFGSSTSIATPRSAGKPVRYSGSCLSQGKSAKSVGTVHGESEPRIELREDPTFWMDHNVQVLIRARPLSGAEVAQHGVGRCVRQENAHAVSWLGQPETRFTFDHVAGEFVTQEELFRVAGLPMVDNCMAGYNSCMFAYGQTGSGKTHTMLGDIGEVDEQPNENRGMTPRVFEYLFAKILKEEEAQKHAKLKYKCTCSFLELYNEQITDLLEPSSTNLQMREDLNKGVYVEGLLEVEVQNVQDVLHLLLLGSTNRKVAATNMNRESSRSHCVFTCVIESQWECDSMINFRFGRLNLVDLAGSERQKATGADGERLREAASINKSLSTLGLVIMVLVDVANGKQRHVPYRDSKLTFLLQDSLGGNSKTTIIANISPSTCASSETLSTLKFAQRAKFIQNNAVINEEASGDVRALQEQVQQLKDELARIRRQSVSRMPSVRMSEANGDDLSSSIENNLAGTKDGFDPLRSSTEGSFLPFARAVLGPTALSHKLKATEALLADALRREKLLEKTAAAEFEHLSRMVKHREDEAWFHKSLVDLGKHKIRRLEGFFETDSERSVASQELQVLDDECDNPEHIRLAAENSHLQEQLRRCQKCDAFEEREAMVQDISHLEEKLLDMLDRNISMESPALPKQTALMSELAAEKQSAELLRKEVDSYQRDLSEYRLKLHTSINSSERMSSELEALRMELESSQEECRKQSQELAILQVKAEEVESLELKQAQHQQFMFELKTQLQKSEEKAEQEASRRSQLEVLLQEALLESTNLQTELEWTKDSLEEAEALVETLQRNDPVLEIGDPGGSYESFMIGQLQAEIIEMHNRLEDERKRGRELEEQIAHGNGQRDSDNEGHHKRNLSTESCDATGKRRVRHHDAIMQLQMELESLEGGSPSAPRDAIKGYRWEDGTRDEEAEVKHTMTIMQLQLDMEALEGALAEEKASSVILKQQLEETETKLSAEKEKVETLRGNLGVITSESEPGSGQLLQEAVVKTTGDMEKMEEALVVAREHFHLEKQTLLAAVADAEQRYTVVKEQLDVRCEELQCLEDRRQRAEARELIVQAERVKLEEEIVKLKEQMAQEQEEWVLEKSDLLVAMRESEARSVENSRTVPDLQRMLAGLKPGSTFESAQEAAGTIWNHLPGNPKLVELEKMHVSMTEAVEELVNENTQLQRQMQLLSTEAEEARKLVGQKEEERASVQRKLFDMEKLLEQENFKMDALTFSITEASFSGKSRIGVVKENMRRSATEQEMNLVKSADRSLRALPENRKPRRLSDGGTNSAKFGEKAKQDAGRGRAENNHNNNNNHNHSNYAKPRSKVVEIEEQNLLQSQLDASKVELQTAIKESEQYKALVQHCEAEMERLTLLLLETEERQTKAEQSWMEEKSQLQAHRHDAELDAAAKNLRLPARFAKMEKWRRQVSEADKLMNMLVYANEKAKQDCSLASAEATIGDKLMDELLEMVALTQAQLDATMGHAEHEFRALVAETRLLKSDLKQELLELRKADRAMEMSCLPSVKCLESELRSWEQQCKAANAVLAEQEATIRSLQEEVMKARKQTWSVQADQGATVRALQEKEETIRKLLNEINQLKQSADRNVSLRQSLTKDLRQSLTKAEPAVDAPALRRSFSCKLIEEKEMTLNVLKEETEFLKTLVFSLDTENADLQQQVLDFEAETAALKSSIDSLERELQSSITKRSEDVAALVSELQDSTRRVGELECQRSELRDEMQRQAVSFAALYAELQKQESLEDVVRTDECKANAEEKNLNLQVLERENSEMKAMAERLDADKTALQSESRELKLHMKALQREIETQEAELREISNVRANLEADLQTKLELSMERDKLQEDLNLFMEQLESAQAIADEREAIAAEARKMSELSKTRADEKQVEAQILGRSVEELENTVYALESQVGLLKRECEGQRLLREEMESELQGLQSQISIMHAALSEASIRKTDEFLEMKLRKDDAERMLVERDAEMQFLRNKLEKFQMGSEGSKPVESVEPPPPTIQKTPRGHNRSVSAFGCIKMNHQVHSEFEEERKANQRRIQELEDVLENHENEVTMLHEKLADAERMTRDVLRVLRGVKVDMTNVATLLDEQEVEEGRQTDSLTLQKDEEIEQILTRLNDFIIERESWLETISRKQAELVASQAAVEKLRESEKSLLAENKKFKMENRTQLKKIVQLEQENKTLSGQQNLQQRIKHHARIKDENNTLRIQNNELSSKLRRAEHLNTRISEELAKYRTAQGKPKTLNVEEEQRLRTLLQEVEEQRDVEAQKLVRLCAGVVKAAGMLEDDHGTDPTVALEAIEQLKDQLESTRQEFEDFKLKTRIMGERQRLNEMRTANSPLRGIDPQLTPR